MYAPLYFSRSSATLVEVVANLDEYEPTSGVWKDSLMPCQMSWRNGVGMTLRLLLTPVDATAPGSAQRQVMGTFSSVIRRWSSWMMNTSHSLVKPKKHQRLIFPFWFGKLRKAKSNRIVSWRPTFHLLWSDTSLLFLQSWEYEEGSKWTRKRPIETPNH